MFYIEELRKGWQIEGLFQTFVIFQKIVTFEVLGDAWGGSWLLYTIPYISTSVLHPSNWHISEELYPLKSGNSIIVLFLK